MSSVCGHAKANDRPLARVDARLGFCRASATGRSRGTSGDGRPPDRPAGRRRACRASRSSSRRARSPAARSRTTRRDAAARTGDRDRAVRRRRDPRPSRAPASAGLRGCSASDSRVDRSASVSSMRSRNVPSLPCAQQPVEERRAGVPDVQLTGRAGSESYAHTSVGSRQSAVESSVGVVSQA